MTFSSLIAENKIVIPLLQRDYVQGNKAEIATKFLDAIFSALCNNTPLHLDFVYGYVDDGKFAPIDGQQRLTTLFLLHLYFGYAQEFLHNFNYETRQTTSDFCNFIVKNFDDIKSNQGKIKHNIENHREYLHIFSFDPSVKAMIKMLEQIDEFASKKQLERPNLDLICFECYRLDGIKTGEELYIKMNARGRLLSDFENFKSKTYQKLIESGLAGHANEFANKIDGKWTDEAYNIANKLNDNFNSVNNDTNDIILHQYWVFCSEFYDKFTKDLKSTSSCFNNDRFSDDKIDFLFSAMDNLEDIFNYYNEYFTNNIDYSKIKIQSDGNTNLLKTLFEKSSTDKIGAKFSLKQGAMLFFYIDFMRHKTTSKEVFIDFLRLVNNLLHSLSTINFDSITIKTNAEQFYKTCRQIYQRKNELNYDGFIAHLMDASLPIQARKITAIRSVSIEVERSKREHLSRLDEQQQRAFLELEQSEYFYCDASIALECNDYLKVQNIFNIAKNYTKFDELVQFIRKLLYYVDISIYAHKNGSLYFGLKRTKLNLAPLFSLKYKDDWFSEQNNVSFKDIQLGFANFINNFNHELTQEELNNFTDAYNYTREVLVKFPEFFSEKSKYNIFSYIEPFNQPTESSNNDRLSYIYRHEKIIRSDNIINQVLLYFIHQKLKHLGYRLEDAKKSNNYVQYININNEKYGLIDNAYKKLCEFKQPIAKINDINEIKKLLYKL